MGKIRVGRHGRAARMGIGCPRCGSEAGQKCVNLDKERMVPVHIERRRALMAWRKQHPKEYEILIEKMS